jgi:hypothetical protein
MPWSNTPGGRRRMRCDRVPHQASMAYRHDRRELERERWSISGVRDIIGIGSCGRSGASRVMPWEIGNEGGLEASEPIVVEVAL